MFVWHFIHSGNFFADVSHGGLAGAGCSIIALSHGSCQPPEWMPEGMVGSWRQYAILRGISIRRCSESGAAEKRDSAVKDTVQM